MASNSWESNFLSCRIDSATIADVSIVDGNDIDEFGEDKKVSKDLIGYLLGAESTRTKNVKVVYTDCPTAYGDFGLKIILIEPQKIVLCNYYEAFFLSKLK